MLKWDIWQLNQDAARNATDPQQPNDATKERRYFIILSPSAYMRTASVAVCIPIQTLGDGSSFSVLIHGAPSSSGIPYNSYARCTDFYTFETRLFHPKKIGFITRAEQNNVEFAIKEFFGLI